MVESKLESLVQRLEAAVARQEALAGGAGAASAGSAGGAGGCPLAKQYAAAVKPLIDDLKAKTAAAENQYVSNLTAQFIKLVFMQGQTITTMARFAKPADIQFLMAPLKFAYDQADNVKRDRKSPINQVSVIMDAQQLFQYPGFADTKTLVDTMEEYYNMLPFNGNKILRTDVQKDIDWYNSVMALCAAIKTFIQENCQKIFKWTGQEDGSGASAYFASATTDDKLNDFSSLEGGAASSASATPSGVSAASKPSGPAGALAGEMVQMATPLINELKAKSAALGNATVTQAMDFYSEAALQHQSALLSTMASFRKPADVSFVSTGSKVAQMMTTVDEAGKKDRKSPMDVMKVFTDGFQLFFWNTTPGNDLLNDYLTECESQVLFFGNRIRKKGKEEEQAWFEAYFAWMTAHIAFVRERKEYICDWKGTQDGAGAAAFYASQGAGSGASVASTTPAAKPEEEKKVAAPAKPAAGKGAAGAKKPAEPAKTKRGNMWEYANYTNETIILDDPDLVNKRMSFQFFNCNKCQVKIVGKCQNISIQSCKNTKFETDMVVSQVEVFKCQALELKATGTLPMAAVEGCNQVNIFLNNATSNAKISTSCTRSTIMHFPKAGITDDQLEDMDNWMTVAVPEVFTTTIDADKKLITEGYKEED